MMCHWYFCFSGNRPIPYSCLTDSDSFSPVPIDLARYIKFLIVDRSIDPPGVVGEYEGSTIIDSAYQKESPELTFFHTVFVSSGSKRDAMGIPARTHLF